MTTVDDLAHAIADVPDFPKPGVTFKDITPLLSDPALFRFAVDELAATAPEGIEVVCGMESRGFIVGAPVALALGARFVPVRKPGKLPRPTIETSFELEYGQERLAMHTDAIAAGDRVLIVDDVLATGGTMAATADLIRRLGGDLIAASVLIELSFLNPRALLRSRGITAVHSVVSFSE